MSVQVTVVEPVEARTQSGEVVSIPAGMMGLQQQGETYRALLPTGVVVKDLRRDDIDALKSAGKIVG